MTVQAMASPHEDYGHRVKTNLNLMTDASLINCHSQQTLSLNYHHQIHQIQRNPKTPPILHHVHCANTVTLNVESLPPLAMIEI